MNQPSCSLRKTWIPGGAHENDLDNRSSQIQRKATGRLQIFFFRQTLRMRSSSFCRCSSWNRRRSWCCRKMSFSAVSCSANGIVALQREKHKAPIRTWQMSARSNVAAAAIDIWHFARIDPPPAAVTESADGGGGSFRTITSRASWRGAQRSRASFVQMDTQRFRLRLHPLSPVPFPELFPQIGHKKWRVT